MTKVFQSSPTSKILSTNSENTIEVNKDNIIEADSQLREVIQKGYLLTQINLSTIPDIIQEAIDKAILDAKTQTLADSLISTMRQTIENFDDGVYKKTYIDTTITYLEQLLTQKASPEIVASIAEAKIAIATADFATTSQVGTLSSRLQNSEVEITNIKETITTKDVARATQIEDLQASIDQSLSNYSEAIDLYVDAEGNVKSQKIEKLEAGNSVSKVTINELNEVVLDEAGNYNAISAKVIFDSDGKIVGFNFSDTNELTTFTINADVFKIANSTNTRTPFKIENNELYFDGKVTFSNITDKTSVVTMDNVEDAILNNVATIDGSKIAAGSIFSHQIEANAITGKNITGGTIRGTQIIGSVIKGSYIDLTTTLMLTNWQLFAATKLPISSWSYSSTLITIHTSDSHGLSAGSAIKIERLSTDANAPIGNFVVNTVVNSTTFTFISQVTPYGTPSVSSSSYVEVYSVPLEYIANFAHHNDGALVVDSEGYVRLAGQQNFIVSPIVQSGTLSSPQTREINLTYDLYSWNSYKINTLQRSIREDTAFTSTSQLIFSASGGSSGAGGGKYFGATFSFNFLNQLIVVNIGAFGSNAHNSAQSSITFNGSTVASASGSLGTDLTQPWDSGWLDFSTSIKGIPISINTTIDWEGSITFKFKATLSSAYPIIKHSVNDVIKINNITMGGNSYTTPSLSYSINYPSVWVQ